VDSGALLARALRAAEEQLGVDAFLVPSDQLGLPQGVAGLAVDLFFVGLNVLLL
jgi:hypothetical protein